MTRTEDTRDAGVVHWDESRDAWVYRASGFGSCIGALVRARMGVDADGPPDWMMQRYEEGRDFEDPILERVAEEYVLLGADEMTARGLVVDELGQIETEIKVPLGGGRFAYVVCHPDGMLDEGLPVEVKATSPDFAKTIRKQLPPLYAWQVSIEAAALRSDKLLFVVGEKVCEEGDEERANLTLGHISMDVISPPYTRADIMKRVLAVERMAESGEVPFCEYRQFPCGYYTDHDPDDPLWGEDAEVEVPEEDREAFDYAVDDHATLHAAEQEIKKDKREAAKVVIAFFDRWGAKGLAATSKGRKVRDTVQVRKASVDWARMAAEHGIDAEQYRDGGETEVRFPVIGKVKKDG